MILLFDHQKEVIDRLRPGSILCGEVGSGKSITALYYYFTRVCCGVLENGEPVKMASPKDLYIITTAKKRNSHEWERECSRFLLDKNPENSLCHVKVVIDSWNNIEKYADVSGNVFFIFDEQKTISYGKWAKTFLKISRNNNRNWLLLSGTPGDKWIDYLPVFIANGFLRNKTEFIKKYVVYNNFLPYAKIDHYVNVSELIKMKKRVLVNMNYENKHKRCVEIIRTEYDSSKYSLVVKDRWDVFLDKPIENPSRFCSVLRQICSVTRDRMVNLIRIANRHHKVLLFYNYDYELQFIKDGLSKNNEHASKCNGSQISFSEYNGHKHEPIPESNKWVYLVQYNAGAEAWECLETNCMVFWSPNYSYMTMKQSCGRIDRAVSPFSEYYYYLFTTDSKIDKRVISCLKDKRNFSENTYSE